MTAKLICPTTPDGKCIEEPFRTEHRHDYIRKIEPCIHSLTRNQSSVIWNCPYRYMFPRYCICFWNSTMEGKRWFQGLLDASLSCWNLMIETSTIHFNEVDRHNLESLKITSRQFRQVRIFQAW